MTSLLLTGAGSSSLGRRAINNAFIDLGFNKEYSEVLGSYYIKQTASLDGTVYDETPSRKDRQELSARATSFATNQYFNGPVDIAGWTEFSISCWIRHGEVAANMYAMGSYGATTANRAFIFGVLTASDVPYLAIYNNSGVADARITFPANSTNDNSWHLLTATYDFATETMTGYIDGRDVTAASTVVAGTNGSINTTQDPDDFTIGTLLGGITVFDWNGQLQLPMIYEGIWTPSEVRDLYLQNYENVTSPTHGWLLDGDTAHSIAGSSSLAPSNAPTRYEDQQSPDWLNMQGWSFGNKLRLTKTPVDGDTFTFKFKGAELFIFITNSANIGDFAAVAQEANASDALFFADSISVDGTSYTTLTRGDFYDLICDGVEHEVIITMGSVSGNYYEDFYTKVETGNYGGAFELDSGYCRLTHINGVPITADDIDFDNTTVLAPKVFSANQDTDGYAGNDNSFGDCKRNWQLRGGPAINLDGVNQYGTLPSEVSTLLDIANSYTVSLQFTPDDITSVQILLSNGISISNRFSMQVHDDGSIRAGAYDGSFYAKSGGSVSVGVASKLVCSWDGSSVFRAWLDGVELLATSGPTTDQSGGLAIGRRPSASLNHFNGQVWNLEVYDSAISSLSDLDSLTATHQYPISEQTGTTSYDVSGNGKNIEWQNSPDWDSSANDSYFWSEAKGCSSVPIFVDGVELTASGNTNMDGIKTASIEIDFLTRSKTNTVYTQGSVAPFRIGFTGAGFSFAHRDDNNTVQSATIPMTYETDVLYRLKFDLVEDETNPTTASYATVSDRITGEVYGTVTGLNFAASTATSNFGPIQIGSYANATSSVDADIYRVRSVIGGVEELLWTSENYLINQADDSAMKELGGTFETKLIPALADGSADANGYEVNNPAGAYHNDSQALLEEFPVTNSDSQGDVFYAAGFNGTLDANINADTNITGFPFSIEFDVRTEDGSPMRIASISPSNSQYHYVELSTSNGIFVKRRLSVSDPTATNTGFTLINGQWHNIKVTFESSTSFSIEFDGSTTNFSGLTAVNFANDAKAGGLWIGQFRELLGSSPVGKIKNVVVKQGDTIVNDMPLYKDALDRSDNNFHGTVTDANFLFESRELDLNPTIAQTNTRAVTTGDRSIVRIGPKAAFAGNDVALLVQGDAVVPAVFDKDVAITPIDFGAETTGGGPAYTYTISAGALPTGLTIDASTGIISGTPTVAELGSFTVRATDFYGSTASSSSIAWQSSSVPSAISDASTAMSINDAQETGGVWLSDVTPTIEGVVQDETLERKDRTRLSCRASDFAVNQYFNGPVDIAGWTEFSISCWIRHGEVAANMYAMGSYGTAANQAFRFGVRSNEQPVLLLQDNSGASDGVIDFPANSTNDNFWHLLTVTYDFATETAKCYLDGRDVTAASTVTAGTNGSINTSQNPNDFTIGALKSAPTSSDWNGQLQQPLIYEGIWSAAQVRDLYLQQVDDIPITYGWFLDSDTASGLTSSCPALTPTNSPDIYEDDAVPVDWLNEKGWTDYENLVYPSEDFSAGNGWGPTNGGIRNGDGSFTFPTVSSRIQNGQGPSYEIGTTYRIVAQFEPQDVGKDIQLIMFYGGSWQGEDVTIDSNAVATTTITPTGIAGTNIGIRYSTGEVTVSPVSYWIYKEENASSYIETTSSIVSYAIIPKRWDEELDSAGQPAANSESFGVARRDGQLVGSSNCISLDGVNQYGVVDDDDIFSFGDGVTDSPFSVSMSTNIQDAAPIKGLFSKALTVGDGEYHAILFGGRTYFRVVDKSQSSYLGVMCPVELGLQNFLFTYDGSGLESGLKIYIDGVLQAVTSASAGTYFAMENTSEPFEIGRREAGTPFEGQIWDVRIYDSEVTPSTMDTVDPIAHWPIAEGSGDVSYDVSGNGKNCDWVNSPSWGTQSQYFWNENQGCSSVPIFVDGVELVGGSVNYDGVKSSVIELDFCPKESGTQTIFTNGSVGPLRVRTVSESLQINIRNSSNAIQSYNLFSFVSGTVYRIRIEVIEDEDNPSTASSIVCTDRITGAVLYENTSANLSLSAASSNNGQQQIGNYTSASQTFTGDVYYLKHVAGGVEKAIVNFPSFVNEALGSNFIDIGGTLEFKQIPALAAGTNDANGYPLTNPAGPWLYEGLGDTYVNFDVIPNANQWLEQRWQGAEFDGTTARENLGNQKIVDGFDLEFLLYMSSSGSEPIIDSTNNNQSVNPGLNITKNSSQEITFSFRGSTGAVTYATNTGIYRNRWTKLRVNRTDDTITFYIDGVAVQSGSVSGVGYLETESTTMWLMGHQFSSYSPGVIRSFSLKNGATTLIDRPYLGVSLDLSDNLDNGLESGLEYLRLTDVRYQAGDTVEQPFSVSTTGNKVYDLVKFTFPVTTLSNTFTISQIVYEDGHTITEDSSPIYES